MRHAFTLVELLLVVAVLLVLMAVGIASMGRLLDNAKHDATRSSMGAIAMTMAGAPTHRGWMCDHDADPTTPAQARVASAWDANASYATLTETPGDGLIDGRTATAPDAAHDGFVAPDLIGAGHRGFAIETSFAGKVSTKARPIDAWGGDIRIARDATTGATLLTSDGRDRLPGTADDLSVR